MSMCVFACMYVDVVHACCLWRPEGGVGHPIAGVTDAHEPP